MTNKIVIVAGALLLLAGCGQRQKLAPPEGHKLPPKPATARAVPEVTELLKPPVQTRPGRSDDALTKSQVRPEDRFDLPPPG